VSADPYHSPLYITYAFKPNTKPIKLITFRDYKIANYGTINDFHLYFNWVATFMSHNVNDTGRIFNEVLSECIDRCVPLKTFSEPKFPRWIFSELKNLIFQKKCAHLAFKKSDYNLFSKCKFLSKANYLSYTNQTEDALSHSPRHFWKYIRDLKRNS